ncbi:hypothetical protein [Komagataeibacter diospyri]|uniref:hypothetical protein n=1 Tax=Komagataeibacter diospyri TaxID=1932662 RepID=UPI0037584A58
MPAPAATLKVTLLGLRREGEGILPGSVEVTLSLLGSTEGKEWQATLSAQVPAEIMSGYLQNGLQTISQKALELIVRGYGLATNSTALTWE